MRNQESLFLVVVVMTARFGRIDVLSSSFKTLSGVGSTVALTSDTGSGGSWTLPRLVLTLLLEVLRGLGTLWSKLKLLNLARSEMRKFRLVDADSVSIRRKIGLASQYLSGSYEGTSTWKLSSKATLREVKHHTSVSQEVSTGTEGPGCPGGSIGSDPSSVNICNSTCFLLGQLQWWYW